MYDFSSRLSEGELRLFLSGELDTAAAAAIESGLFALTAETPHERLVLDLGGLLYVSSAGLRLILRLCKSEAFFSVENVSSEIYRTLEMTGFTELMRVERAFRELDITGLPLIGEGASGFVYRLDDETVVKVYRDPDALPSIRREKELAKKAFLLGIPTAISFDTVRVGERYGSVFELLRARSFAEILREDPSAEDRLVPLSADLMRKIHSLRGIAGDFPSAREEALRAAEYLRSVLPAAEAGKLRALFEALPDSPTLLHGDLHVKNLMLENGELRLIDMETLAHGDPVFELANLYAAYLGYSENDPQNAMDFFGLPYETTSRLWRRTLALYLGEGADPEPAEKKARLVCYTFLYRTFAQEAERDEARLALYLAELRALLGELDSVELGKDLQNLQNSI